MPIERRWLSGLATCGLALGLTLVFWWPIWHGAGFVGGDIYSYFFPQKVIYSEALQAGELPLWNDRAGFGYPLLAESQTGIFYPPNVLLYRVLDPHSAFHVSFLLHYFAAFVFATAAIRRLKLSLLSAWLAALVYVYGWFPARTCVEWAIIGGTWLPAALWCAESFLTTRLWRFAIGLSGVLAVQLLAGHFQIAWFTLLLLTAYVPARLFWIRDHGHRSDSDGPDALAPPPGLPRWLVGFRTSGGRVNLGSAEANEPPGQARWGLESISPSSRGSQAQPRRSLAILIAAMFCGLGLAAVQLLPTYELKQRSQRATVGKEHELDFGAIPPWYWSQVFRPSHWYSPLTDREAAFAESPPLGHSRTNSAEAHLYFGIAPWLLALVSLTSLVRDATRRRRVDRAVLFWTIIAAVSGLYTSGWLLPLTQHLPGFSYFQGAGRYGLLTTFAVAVLAASVLDRFLREPELSRQQMVLLLTGIVWSLGVWFLLGDDTAALVAEAHVPNPLSPSLIRDASESPLGSLMMIGGAVAIVLAISFALWWWVERPASWDGRVGFVGLLLLTTSIEFWTISRLVTFAPMVPSPPLKSLEQSPVRRELQAVAKARPTLRLFAPGANLPSTLGVSSAPIYLTFGPAEYVDDSLRLPRVEGTTIVPASGEQLDWLRRSGVTHVLSFEPPALAAELSLVWSGDDPFLNRAWGRTGQPLFLYEIPQSLGRLQVQSLDGEPHDTSSWRFSDFQSSTTLVSCSIETQQSGRLVLADLDDPGWSVTVDGQPATSTRVAGQFRAVEIEAGSHRVVWSYRPRSVLWGAVISLGTLLFLAAVAHVRFWHPHFGQGNSMPIRSTS